MSQVNENPAWLEGLAIGVVPITGTCSVGRSSSNNLVLSDAMISRHHAVIHAQAGDEYWLTDLGSSNGVFVNGRRLTKPVRLDDEDQITIGPFQLTFRQPMAPRPQPSSSEPLFARTISDVRAVNCWLLVTDILDSTKLSQRVPPEQLPSLIDRYLERCVQIIEKEGGALDKHLGDGFLAYWRDAPQIDEAVARALEALKTMQSSSDLPFRMIVHFGRVFSGGPAASGVERFFGPEVNFIFKAERLASTLGIVRLMTQNAFQKIQNRLPADEIEQHEVNGVDGHFSFYRF